MEEFNAERQLARVSAGFKGGPFNKNPSMPTPKTFVEGWPAEVLRKLKAGPIPQPTPEDPWNMRRSK